MPKPYAYPSDVTDGDLRGLIRLGEGRRWHPAAAVLDSRTRKSTASSEGAAYDGAKRVKGRKLHLAVDTLGHLLAAVVSAADAEDRAVVAELCAEMQAEVAGSVTAAFVDQGYTGCWWRSTRDPGGGSCSCPAAGSWSARSPG